MDDVHTFAPQGKAWKPGPRRLALVFLLLFFAQVALAARHTSITLDEPLHITSGYACLLTGDYRLVEEHPPLLKMLQAFPLLFLDPPLPDPRTVPGWAEGDLIAAAQQVVVPYRPIEPPVRAARVPTMLIGVLLGALVYRWAADLFGSRAGAMALALYTFDPNMLAHAGVAATDLGAACALFGATYLFWRWLRTPTWRRALTAAVALGLALGVKTTALLLPPVFVLLIAAARPARASRRSYFPQVVMAAGVAFLVLWAIYRFEVRALPGLPFPLPAASHLLPLLKLREHMREGHAAFLMGRNYHHGVWYYFPVAFALKTPPLTLVLLVVATVGWGLRRLPRLSRRDELALLTLPVLYFGLSLTSSINIGYRHLLPVLPFLFVHVSRLAVRLPRPAAYGLGLALAAYAAVTLTLFPWHLTYFNFLAGGPRGGYRYLVDSNLDWGQTWKALRRYLEDEGITAFGLSQYTINDPHAYGLDYTPLPPWPDAPPVLPRRFDPAPGVYAISPTTLQGVVVAEPEIFDYFRHREPVARVGNAMFVYRVEAHPPTAWVAQCTNPVAPLPPQAVAEGFGRDDLRLAYFDCAQSWLYPPGNGWYVLPYDAPMQWSMAAHHLREARLAFVQTRRGLLPPFRVYEWFDREALGELSPRPVRAAPSPWPPLQVEAEGVLLTPPVPLGASLAFLGVTSDGGSVRAGETFTLRTYWRVLRTPDRPLSLMAHLLAADGHPLAVGDGLGVPVEQWRAGDLLVQQHRLRLPGDAPPGEVWLQVGAYTLPDVVRLSVRQGQTVVGDRLLVGRIEVEP